MARPIKKDVPLSICIRDMMSEEDLSQEDVAEVLRKSIPVLRNKLSNGSFSVEELLAIIEIAECKLYIENKRGRRYRFHPEEICSEELQEGIKNYWKRREYKRRESLEKALEENDPETVKQVYSRWRKKREKVDAVEDPTD